MPERVYKYTEVVGSSKESQDDAIRNAVSKANESLRGMRWFEVTETRGTIENGQIIHWQVGLKIGFTLEGQA